MSIPIKHVVIIVKENHTFDNYFGTLADADGDTLPHAPNPPTGSPDHKHQTWMNRAADTLHKIHYKESDIPGYFAYARKFTICDNYFSELLRSGRSIYAQSPDADLCRRSANQ
jgi:phospholipase C